jgi:hypothetical protein
VPIRRIALLLNQSADAALIRQWHGRVSFQMQQADHMTDVSLSATTRAALNGGGSAAISALKVAAESDRAIVAVVEQVAEAVKALPPPGQGQNVDRRA